MAAASGGVDLSMGASSSTRAWACGLPITSIRAGGRRRIPEPMCLAAEDEDKRARLGDARGVTDHKMHFPVEHVERLVVAVMHMQRYRRRPGRQLLLEYAEVRCARFNLHLGATAQEWPSTAARKDSHGQSPGTTATTDTTTMSTYCQARDIRGMIMIDEPTPSANDAGSSCGGS
jgi:hypothetical protein